MVDTCCRNGDMGSVTRMGLGEYFTDPRGLGHAEGRKRLEQPPSDTMVWRPAKKKLDEPGHEHLELPQGLRKVERPEAGEIKKRNERLHIRQGSSKEEFSDRPIGVKIVFGENGLMAKDQTAQEVDLAHVMTRRKNCGTLEEQRNGLPCRSLGDKYYKHPEYSLGYWKVGEQAVGSSFVQGSFPKTVARNSTAWKAFAAENPNAVKRQTYVEAQRIKLAKEQRQEVELLTGWERQRLDECADAERTTSWWSDFKDTLDMLEEASDDEDPEAIPTEKADE